MKVAFDEHVPVQMVRVFKSLGGEKRFRDFEFVSAKDYAPDPTDPDYIRKSDVPWLERFAKDGGKIVISGDTKMVDRPAEIEALRQAGFTVFFFERKWNNWDFYQKSALVLFYWSRIAMKIARGKSGKFWRIPNHFKTDDALRNVTPGKKQIRKTSSAKPKAQAGVTSQLGRRTAQSPKRKKSRPNKPIDPRQIPLGLSGGGPRERKT